MESNGYGMISIITTGFLLQNFLLSFFYTLLVSLSVYEAASVCRLLCSNDLF